jgi:hypothetical protein
LFLNFLAASPFAGVLEFTFDHFLIVIEQLFFEVKFLFGKHVENLCEWIVLEAAVCLLIQLDLVFVALLRARV